MARLASGRLQLGNQLAEYFPGVTVNWQQRFAPQPREGA